MITLKTITTIELSTECQLSCQYCINRKISRNSEWCPPARSKGIMTDETFERSMHWLIELCTAGTQGQVNLNGNGESCLDPQLPERIKRVREVMGYGRIAMCTNGVNLTASLARKIADAGIDQFDLSPHSPVHARKAWQIINNVGLRGIINFGSIMSPHNWADQIDEKYRVSRVSPIPCVPLIEGRGYIQMEGSVSPCCYDYRSLGAFGSVFDDDLLVREIKPYELCKTCHQVIPAGLCNEY